MVPAIRSATPVPFSDGFSVGSGISGRTLIARTPNGSQVLPRESHETVFNTVAAPTGIKFAPSQRGTLLAQLPLRPPAAGPTAEGIAQIYKSTHGGVLSLMVSGFRLTGFHDDYAVWLYINPHTAQLLGFIAHRRGPQRNPDHPRATAVRWRVIPPHPRHARESDTSKDPRQDYPQRSPPAAG